MHMQDQQDAAGRHHDNSGEHDDRNQVGAVHSCERLGSVTLEMSSIFWLCVVRRSIERAKIQCSHPRIVDIVGTFVPTLGLGSSSWSRNPHFSISSDTL